MLYQFFKWLVKLTLHSYFRKIVITGYRNIPSKGPVIFVANHPSAFMDPMVVATSLDQSINFLAAAEFFGKGIKSWFYQKQLNMIPVFRPAILPGEAYKNEEVFSKCFELLGSGGSILVFPEGNSITEKRIRKLKTGVARMALGTTESTHGAVHVVVVPIGLNYTNPHRFQSDVFVNIGQPISTHPFKTDNSHVVKLTEEIEAGLKQTVLHIQTEELDSVVKKIEVIMKPEFQGRISHRKKKEFLFHQKVIMSIEEMRKKEPLQISALETKLDNYLNKIRSLGISDGSLARLSTLISLGELVRLILAFPLFLFGYSINSIPYQSTVWYFRRLNLFSREGYTATNSKANPAFKGSVAMGIGMALFIVFYLLMASLTVWFTGKMWVGIALLILSYFAGLFAMRYIRWFYLLRQKWKLKKLINENREMFASLIIERQQLINELKVITTR